MVTLPFRFSTPPLTLPREAEPATVQAPALTVDREADPPTVKEPPLRTVAVALPATDTVPEERLPPKLRLLAKRVLPVPVRVPSVIVPLVPLKRRLFAEAFVFATTPAKVRPVPETVARPVPLTVKGAAEL